LAKAPDAFRTISEVAGDLDIPQHVLRFWETRFTQIKPMKRSGGRRYYRSDDVDLLRGIRRLLYGEGYTIRGVQRILREHGIKAVQSLADADIMPPSPTSAVDRHDTDGEEHHESVPPAIDIDEDDTPAQTAPVLARDRSVRLARVAPSVSVEPSRMNQSAASASIKLSSEGTAQLSAALNDLLACKTLVDETLKRSAPDLFPLK
jgi:DNA-binding transcriptional MerR regulator